MDDDLRDLSTGLSDDDGMASIIFMTQLDMPRARKQFARVRPIISKWRALLRLIVHRPSACLALRAFGRYADGGFGRHQAASAGGEPEGIRLAGISALNCPSLASSNWYCLTIGIRPLANHSDTAGAVMPSANAILAFDLKNNSASNGVMPKLLSMPNQLSISMLIDNLGTLG